MNARAVERDQGFSLVEVCIGIFIASIVLTMTAVVLFSTFSSGTALMSKQQVAADTRFSLSRILKDLGSAQSTLRCTVFKSSELQTAYETYLRRVENGGDDPTTPIIESGTPSFSGSSADCLEYYETGHVLMRVLPNSVCWFVDLSPGADDTIDFSKSFRTACLFRGGAGRDAQYGAAGTDVGYGGASVVSMPCSPDSGQATDEDVLYYLECEYNNSDMHYFVPNESSSSGWSLVSDSYRQVLELGTPLDETVHPRTNIFSYTSVNSSTPDFVNTMAGNNSSDILYINVNMNVLYNTGKSDSDGPIQKKYHYAQTVLLNGAKTYNDEGAYSDKFTG